MPHDAIQRPEILEFAMLVFVDQLHVDDPFLHTYTNSQLIAAEYTSRSKFRHKDDAM